MITVISKPSHNFYPLACYHQQKIEKDEAEIIDTYLLTGISPLNINRTMRFFCENEKARLPVFHVSLDFPKSKKSKLTNELFRKIGQEYMNAMGYGEQPYIIYRHNDANGHPTLYILGMRVDLSHNRGVNESFEKYHSKEIAKKIKYKYRLAERRKSSEEYYRIMLAVETALVYNPIDLEELNLDLLRTGSDYQIYNTGIGIQYYRIDDNSSNVTMRGGKFKNVGYDRKGLESIFEDNIWKWMHCAFNANEREARRKRRSPNLEITE